MLGQADRKSIHRFRPVPAVRLDDGLLAPTAEAATERWRAHFAKSELGIAVSCPQLQELARVEFRVYPPGSFDLDLSSIPTLTEVEQYIRRAKKHKAPGRDFLFAEIYQLDAPCFSRILWPLLAKCTVRCSEPLQWKGGEVFSLPKTSAVSFDVDKFRSILLADFSSKVRHGIVRSKLLPHFLDFKEPMQAGGIPKLCPDFLTLYVQSYAFWTRTQNLSCAFLYVDIKQAFYKACRALLTKRPLSDAQIVQVFHDNGWGAELMHDFFQRLAEPDALQQAGVSSHMRAQVSDLLTSTWFHMRNDNHSLTHTAAGTRPGDSIADLLYAFIMTRFIKVVKARFIAEGLHANQPVQWIPACAVSPDEVETPQIVQACWVDDLVRLLHDAQPDTLIAKPTRAAAIVQDTSVEFALALNYSRDKTSALVSLRGPGARATWAKLLPADSATPTTLDFSCRSVETPLSLHIVPDYIYFGTLIDATGHPASEIKRRFLAVQSMKRMLSKNIFKAPSLPFRTKCPIFRSLAPSRLLYGSGAWQPMNTLTLQSFCTQLVQLYRFLTPQLRPGAGARRLDFVAASEQPPPMLQLALQRFSLFDRHV